jgi:hypothetical protein
MGFTMNLIEASRKVSRVDYAKNAETRWKWLFKISAVAALTLGILFLAAILSLLTTSLRPDAIDGWLSLLQNNWLVILFKLNAGFDGVQFDQLYGPNLLDLAIMVFVTIVYLGLYVVLRRTSRIGSIVAAVMPLLGIVLFIVTKLAGRSGGNGCGSSHLVRDAAQQHLRQRYCLCGYSGQPAPVGR